MLLRWRATCAAVLSAVIILAFYHSNHEAILDHYSNGVTDSPTLDPLLKTKGRLGIELTATEKTQIIAFLKTLTDETFLNKKELSEFN